MSSAMLCAAILLSLTSLVLGQAGQNFIPPPSPIFKSCEARNQQLSIPKPLGHDFQCWQTMGQAVQSEFDQSSILLPPIPGDIQHAEQNGTKPSLTSLLRHLQSVRDVVLMHAKRACPKIELTIMELQARGTDCCNLRCHCAAITSGDVEEQVTCGGLVGIRSSVEKAQQWNGGNQLLG